MKTEIIEYEGYTAKIIYQPFFDDSTAKSQQYKLIIEKEGHVYIDRYGFTNSGAKTFFKRWVNKKLNKN